MRLIKDSEYYSIRKKSYSMLARFDRDGPMSLIKEFKETPAMLLGSLVDDMVTNASQVDSIYAISKHKTPTASLLVLFDEIKKDFVKFAPKGVMNIDLVAELAHELILWDSVKKPDVFVKKFNTSAFRGYIMEYFNNFGKRVVDQEMWNLADKMAGALLNDKVTGPLFKNEEGESIFQLSILWGDKEQFKSRLDLVVLDHENKLIRPFDLKTMGLPVEEFRSSFMNFRYYIQDAVYTDAVEEWRNETYPDYDIADIENIVISSKEPDNPVLFKVNKDWVAAGKYGFFLGNYRKRGYLELADEVDWHRSNKIYNKSREQVEKGFLSIDFNGRLE